MLQFPVMCPLCGSVHECKTPDDLVDHCRFSHDFPDDSDRQYVFDRLKKIGIIIDMRDKIER
jgi:hypothetical protein